MRELSLVQARQVAVAAQLLDRAEPWSLVKVVTHLGGLQVDPTRVVARAERLVLWSRLGAYDVAELDRELYQDASLFEYSAWIVPMHDFALYRETMRRFPRGNSTRSRYVRHWLAANAAFGRYVLGELRRRGPLRSRDLEDRAVAPWRSGGWNDGKNLGRMLELLWAGGRIAIVRREGNDRVWDLAERRYPLTEPRLASAEVTRRLLERQLRARGVARTDQFGFALDGRPPGWQRELQRLARDGIAVPVQVAGLAGEWFAHAAVLDPDRPFVGRTTLLSPFDRLVANRKRTEELFGFRFRLEIYVPPARRQYGYYVLPILHGERLVGRIDPVYERRAGRLVVNAVYAEPDAPAEAGPGVAAAIAALASWLGASDISLGERRPALWGHALRDLA
jgi:uncharacterized protein